MIHETNIKKKRKQSKKDIEPVKWKLAARS